jgi:hypothetical protein
MLDDGLEFEGFFLSVFEPFFYPFAINSEFLYQIS